MLETSTDTEAAKFFKPFFSGTETHSFLKKNCFQCKKCLEDSTTEHGSDDNECKMYIEVYAGFMTGEISIESAQKIGFLEKEKYQGKCFEFELEYIRPFPDVLANPAPVAEVKVVKVNAMNQTTLF